MKKIHFSSFGVTTILMAFVMICIITFSTLTLVTANSDYKLSKKVADKNEEYYKAEAEAYAKLEEIDETCLDLYGEALDANEYYQLLSERYSLDEDQTLSYTVAAGESQTLTVTLLLSYPESAYDGFYTITGWQLSTASLAVEETNLHLIGQD